MGSIFICRASDFVFYQYIRKPCVSKLKLSRNNSNKMPHVSCSMQKEKKKKAQQQQKREPNSSIIYFDSYWEHLAPIKKSLRLDPVSYKKNVNANFTPHLVHYCGRFSQLFSIEKLSSNEANCPTDSKHPCTAGVFPWASLPPQSHRHRSSPLPQGTRRLQQQLAAPH